MIIDRINKRQSRALAVCLLLLALSGLFSATALPIWLVNDNLQERVDDAREKLARYNSITQQDRQLRQYYSRLTRTRSSSGQLLQSESEAVAAAEMQRVMRAIADANFTELVSTQILPSSALDEEGLRPVGLRVRVQGTLPGLIRTIYGLESNSMLLFLEEFSLRIASNRRIGQESAVRRFEANFDVIGFMSVLK